MMECAKYRRILVPLDGSELAEQVLPHAAAQAEGFGAEIILLKVLGPLPDQAMAGRSALRYAEEMSAELALQYLEGLAVRFRQRGLQAQAMTAEGKPYVEIVRQAEALGADLIVMSTRGYSGLSRWLLGSVTDRVVRGATVPILLIQAECGETL